MRAGNPMAMRQQQMIRQHLDQLSVEDKAKFQALTPQEKHEYLSNRNLLLQYQTQTIVLNVQQREMLQTMNEPQKAEFIQKLRQDKEREMQLRQQQMMQARQQQQQQQYPQQNQPQVRFSESHKFLPSVSSFISTYALMEHFLEGITALKD